MITLARGGQGDLYLGSMLLMVVADGQVQALQQLAQPLGGQSAQIVAEQRQRGQQLSHKGRVRRRVTVELGLRRLALGKVAAQLRDSLHDRLSRLRSGLLILQRQHLPAEPRLKVGDLALQLYPAGTGGCGRVRAVGGGEHALPVAGSLRAVDGGGQEAGHAFQQGRLGDVDARRVACRERAAAEPGWLALVVQDCLLSAAATHPQPAVAADHAMEEVVRRPGVGSRGSVGAPRAGLAGGDSVDLLELPP